MRICEKIQEADWQKEKHGPVIECPDRVKPEEWVQLKISLGKAIAHPNTTEHHIRWIAAYFLRMGTNLLMTSGSSSSTPMARP